jgi:hypothetical protein
MLTILLAAGSVASGADEPMTLRYKMSEEDALIYRTVTTTSQHSEVAGQEIDTKSEQLDVSLRTLKKLDEQGNFHVQTENKQLKIKMSISTVGDYEFDPESGERDTGSVLGAALTPVHESLNGAILTFTHTPRGEIVALEGYQELLAGALKDNPLGAQFSSGGTDEAAKLGMDEVFVTMSETPVQPGDTWETSYEVKLPGIGNAVGKRVYTYEGLEKAGKRTVAKIGVATELSFDLDIDTGAANTSGTVEIEESSGTILFDPEQGQLVSMESKITIVGDFTVTVGGKTYAGDTKQTVKAKIEQLDKLPE